MPTQPLPEVDDWRPFVEALKDRGWLDAEIEAHCGMRRGYIAQLRGGFIRSPIYSKGASLFNLWVRECGQ